MKKVAGIGILALAGAIFSILAMQPVEAGEVNGGRHDYGRYIAANSVLEYTFTYRGGETARVEAIGDGDIDIYVYDSNGDRVAKDNLYDHHPICTWYVPYTQTYTVRVKNCDDSTTRYDLWTN